MTLIGEGYLVCDSCGKMMKMKDASNFIKVGIAYHLCINCRELQKRSRCDTSFISINLTQIAKRLYTRGLNVIPFKITGGKKIPIVKSWGKWQHERQSRREFEELDWEAADAVGIV
ncbi:MAG: hypothetical protein NZ938_04465, partial [Aigarchaeota archaeon]|nr:hypothetical protein [Candidatus Calditenuaceae archaeon]